MVQEGTLNPWETVTGLPNDIDGWIANSRFGFKDEYAAVAGASTPMILFDLVNAEKEVIANPGYSLGGGWVVSEDGAEISHPLRSNIVGSSVYGQLLNRVTKELSVDMAKFGDSPLVAKAWDGLGFHWMQEEHATLNVDKKGMALMPVEFLGELEVKGTPAAKVAKKVAAAPGADAGLEGKLAVLAGSMTIDVFQKAAIKLQGVADNDALIASVLDESDAGFWATHRPEE